MAVIQSYNDLIARIPYNRKEPLYEAITTGGSLLGNVVLMSMHKVGNTKVIPTLETGVSAYIPTTVSIGSSVTNQLYLIGKFINLGSLDISGASGTFTDGASMGTATAFNTTTNLFSPVYMEVATVLNAAPGTITITYVDQDGNSAETTAAQTLANSAAVHSGGVIQLNTGDIGVQDITAAARSGGTTPTGVIRFWGVVPFGIMVGSDSSKPDFEDYITKGFSYHRLQAGDEVGFVRIGGVGTGAFMGYITYIGDST